MCNFLMVKEEEGTNKNSRYQLPVSSSKDTTIDTDITSNFSSISQHLSNENSDVITGDKGELQTVKKLINTGPSSDNRKRRKSFLTGKTDSPFRNSPCLPIPSKSRKDNYITNAPDTPQTFIHRSRGFMTLQNQEVCQPKSSDKASTKTKHFDFDTEDDEMLSTPRGILQFTSTNKELRGSARKKTTDLSSILSNMKRHKRLGEIEQNKEAAAEASSVRNKYDMKKIPSKGSDMSLTLVAQSEDDDSDQMFTQALTQPEICLPKISIVNEVEMEDADNMFTDVFTQPSAQILNKNENRDEHIAHHKISLPLVQGAVQISNEGGSGSGDDSDHMFSQALTQDVVQTSNKDEHGSEDDSDHMFSQLFTQQPLIGNTNLVLSPPNIVEPKDALGGANCNVNHTSLKGNINRIQEYEDNVIIQRKSFQNFSSDSAKTAMESLCTGLSTKMDLPIQTTGQIINPCPKYDKTDQAMGSSENSSGVVDENLLEIDEEEELAVSIMTQAFSEKLSEGVEGTVLSAQASSHHLEEESNEYLPATQPSIVYLLEGVVAVVEVRTGNENRSDCVKNRLQSIGAKVAETLNTSCTHLVFKDGGLSTYNKAKKMGLHIVSVSWIEACRNEGTLLPEANYPCSNRERYENPGLFPKLRKAKSMQPKAHEDFLRTLNMRINRKEKAKQRTEEKAEAHRKAEKDRLYNPFTYRVRHPFQDHFYNSPTTGQNMDSNKKSSAKNGDILHQLQYYASCGTESPIFSEFASPGKVKRMNRHDLRSEEKKPIPETPSPSTSDDLNTPFVKRLANRIYRKDSNKSPSSLPRVANNSIRCSLPDKTKGVAAEVGSFSRSPVASKHIFGIKENISATKTPNCTSIVENEILTVELNGTNSRNSKKCHADTPKSIVRTRSSGNHKIRTGVSCSKKSSLQNRNYSRNRESTGTSRNEYQTDENSKSHKMLHIADCYLETSINHSPIAHKASFDDEQDAFKQKDTSINPKIGGRNLKSKLKQIDDTQNSFNVPLHSARPVVKQRSSNRNSMRESNYCNQTNLHTVVQKKNPIKSNKKVISKKRHVLFSDPSSLLSETPTDSPVDLNIKMPSTLKHPEQSEPRNFKGRKSVISQMPSRASTKIVRSESGSVLFAQPPKSTGAVTRRESKRFKTHSDNVKGRSCNAKENPNGSYENVENKNDTAHEKLNIKRAIAPPRRSTAEFQSPIGPVTRRMSSAKICLPVLIEEIVLTSCSKEDKDLAQQLSYQFGPKDTSASQASSEGFSQSSSSSNSQLPKGKRRFRKFTISDIGKVSTATTHVVCGYDNTQNRDSQCSIGNQGMEQPMVRRTLNLLRGILHGCWILSKNWLYDSLEGGRWADEEMYELVDFSPAVQSMRLAREAFSSPAYGVKFRSVRSKFHYS